MKRKPKGLSERGERRALERQNAKLAQDQARLFALTEGGSAQRPISVESASVVETHALSVPCPRCGGAHELIEHAAITQDGQRLREARLRCRQCGTRRSLFFQLIERFN